jgi:hypothetical protein
MIKLKTEFDGVRDQKGLLNPKLPPYRFKQVDRIGQVALYSKGRGSSPTSGYEVFIIQSIPFTRFPGGNVSEAHEGVPSPEMWGTSAWSYPDLQSARKRFNETVDKQ